MMFSKPLGLSREGLERRGAKRMPTYVDPDKCDGCRALDRLACMYICPMDLMALDAEIGKGYNQEPDLC